MLLYILFFLKKKIMQLIVNGFLLWVFKLLVDSADFIIALNGLLLYTALGLFTIGPMSGDFTSYQIFHSYNIIYHQR